MIKRNTGDIWQTGARWAVLGIVGAAVGCAAVARAAITDVSIGDNFFSPSAVTINVNDSVRWTWDGFHSHSSTGSGTTPLWNSGVHTNGFVYTNKFSVAGQFPYRCTVHAFQTGTVTVQALVDVPPTVAIVSPVAGTTFAAPWSGTVQLTASDSDGTVSKVDLFAGTTLAATTNAPPANFSLRVANLPAGDYTLSAVATDNAGATGSSDGVLIKVVDPVPVMLAAVSPPTSGGFQLSYTANIGLTYVIERSANLADWTAIDTNTAAGTPVVFTDSNAAAGPVFYRVHLLANP